MKTGRILWLVTMITLVSATTFYAQAEMKQRGPQGPHPDPEKVDERIDKLVKELDLSEQQEVKFDKAFRAHMKEMMGNRDAQHEEMELLRADFEKELGTFLDESQIGKFKEISQKKGRKKPRGKARGERPKNK